MITDLLIQLVSHYESLHDGDLHEICLQPKMCPAGFWTEGYGRLVRDTKGNPLKGISNEALAKKYSVIKTKEQAIIALKEDLTDYGNRVDSLKLTLVAYQRDALTDFSYNVGFQALKDSTLLKLIRNKANATQIDKEFRKWNKGGGQVLPGLVARRTSDALMFITGTLKYFN